MMIELVAIAACAGLFVLFGRLPRGSSGCPSDCGCAAGSCTRRDETAGIDA